MAGSTSLNEAVVVSGSGHVSAHNTIHAWINRASNEEWVAAPSGVAATDTANIQAALDIAQSGEGVTLHLAAGVYKISSKLKIYGQTRLAGASWGFDAKDGTTFRWTGGAIASGRGMLECAGFVNNSLTTDNGIVLEHLGLDGGGNSTGNSFIGWGGRIHIEHVWSDGWNGTTAGHGRDLVFASTSSDGTTIINGYLGGNSASSKIGGENNEIFHCRLGSARERIYIGAGNEAYTDGMIDDIESTTVANPPTTGRGANNLADLYMAQAGSWRVNKFHTNGSYGHCIYASGASGLTVTNSFLDGWGCSPTSGETYAAICVGGISGFNGGAGLVILSENNWRARGYQNTTAGPSCKWVVFQVTPGGPGYDQTVIISNNAGHRRSDGGNDATQGSGTTNANQVGNFVFELDQTSSNPGLTTYNIIGNNPLWTRDGTGAATNSLPYSDASVFAVPNGSARQRVNCEGNSFQYGTVAPTAGYWPRNMKRWNDLAASTSMGWGNVTASVPGSWKTMPALGA